MEQDRQMFTAIEQCKDYMKRYVKNVSNDHCDKTIVQCDITMLKLILPRQEGDSGKSDLKRKKTSRWCDESSELVGFAAPKVECDLTKTIRV